MVFEQLRGVHRQYYRRRARSRTQAYAGPDEGIPPARFGPEEHVAIDMSPPLCRPPGEDAGERWHKQMVRHLLGSEHGSAAMAQINRMEVDPIRSAVGEIGRRQQTGGAQPGAGAVSLDDMPDTRVARGKPGGTLVHAIPSTSIIE